MISQELKKKNIEQVIVALDQMSLDDIHSFLSAHKNDIHTIKIGLELFLKHGHSVVHQLKKEYQKKIFLDLKLHDIPKTVEKAIESLSELPIEFLTIHLGGGLEMLKSAKKAKDVFLPNTKLLGVSFLTSLSTNDLQDIYGVAPDQNQEAFLRLFHLANDSKIEGVVCSPHELELLKGTFPSLLAVTPGIRFSDEVISQETQDQKRVMSPDEAIKNGADFLVIGRSLTKSVDSSKRFKSLYS
jgi:orotidine-5'-phosphate decarboxylase